jgi:glycogen(starch) synthase
VQAMPRLRSRWPEIGCVVMGIGADCREASALVAKHGMNGAVWLAGDLDHELCLQLMSRSAVFVRPTIRDGDSISVREAVALSVPVVASRVGTRPDGVLLFEPGDVDGIVEQVSAALSIQDSRKT